MYLGKQMLNFGRVVDFLMYLRLALNWWTFTESFVYLAVQVLFLCWMIVSFEKVEFIIVGISLRN